MGSASTDETKALIAVIGAGTMGAGIAEVAARSGHQVVLYDAAPDAATRAVQATRKRLERDVTKGRLAAERVDDVLALLSTADQVTGIRGAQVVIEAIKEDIDIKQAVVQQVEDLVDSQAIIATNTSSLSVSAIAAGAQHPERIVGLHFFNPPQRMRLVEVVRGAKTSSQVLAQATDLAQSWGKTTVACTSTPGFIVNRVARPFYGESQRLVEEGIADPATIDQILRECARFPMGPFELTDLIGQDVNLDVSTTVWQSTYLDQRYTPTVLQRSLVEAGKCGRKSGEGFFTYTEEGTNPAGQRETLPGDCAPEPTPARVTYRGDWGVMHPLLDRAAQAGVQVAEVETTTGAGSDCSHAAGVLLPCGGHLIETNGTPAGDLGNDVVVLDWVRDPATASRVVIACAPMCSEQTRSEAIGLLQAAGVIVTEVADGPGLVVARTLSMIINEAVDLVVRKEATASDVDIAMRLGTGYPQGPLAWGDELGPACVRDVLEHLHQHIPSGRYRVSPALRRAAQHGTSLKADVGT